jgi:hypothetical protein
MRALLFLFTLLIGAIAFGAIITTLFVTTLAVVTPITIGILWCGSIAAATLIGVLKLILFGL